MSNAGLQLNLFGAPTLVADDRPVTLSPGAVLLCAYLALVPHGGCARSLVATQLFADCPEGTARRRLNTALWRLQSEVRARTGVELFGPHGGRTVALSPSVELTVDAVLFEDLVTPVLRSSAHELGAADVARLEQAVALHRGRLVEPCDDEWVLSSRHRLETLYLTALDHLVQHHGGRGDVVAVGRYGDLALAVEPLREDVHRHLMAAYASAGRQDLVERQFEQCRMVLLTELGADPMPETVALYGRLSRGEGGQTASVAVLVAELERARREVARLGEIVDRALDRLRRMP
ncbi:BTAD domain-containing putative transcriptional regulator [Kocuria sp. M1R5S2]|uniref:AfsR/SARP family transcriptional regulator n=1 Tax=Kocuria rhizosphaerae TaxID=3376285 RepID=UPI00378AA4F6